MPAIADVYKLESPSRFHSLLRGLSPMRMMQMPFVEIATFARGYAMLNLEYL